MPKNALKPADLSGAIQVALSSAPDYSETFTLEVRNLQRLLTDELRSAVEHDEDMNYSSAQKLVVWLDQDGDAVTPRAPEAAYRLIVFVSSKGHFFTFVTLGLSASTAGWQDKGLEKPARSWSEVPKNQLPDEIQRLQKRIASRMTANGYKLLSEPVLSREATGHWTKLDGRPASVFEILFSEMI